MQDIEVIDDMSNNVLSYPPNRVKSDVDKIKTP